MWPTSLPFSFKNVSKVYGSPMLDAAIRCSNAGNSSENFATSDTVYAALLAELQEAAWMREINDDRSH